MKFFLTFLVAICALCVIEFKFALTEHSIGVKSVRKYKEPTKFQRKHKGSEKKHCGKSSSEEHKRKSSSSESDESNDKQCHIIPEGSPCTTDANCTRCLTPSFKYVSRCWALGATCVCSSANHYCDSAWICCDGSACQANNTCPSTVTGGICLMGSFSNFGICATGTCQPDPRAYLTFNRLYGICVA